MYMYIWHKLNVYLKNKNIQFEHATSNQIPTRAKHEQACRVYFFELEARTMLGRAPGTLIDFT